MGLQNFSSDFRRFGLVLLAAAGTCTYAQWARAETSPEGVWLNDSGRGAIEIKSCGEGYCGHVVWVRQGVDSMGCGKQIIGELTSGGDGTFGGGWIYNPDKKKRYDVEIVPLEDGTLRVTGYAGVRFLSRTMIWTPAPKDLERCDGSAAAAPGGPALATAVIEAAPAAKPQPVRTAKAEEVGVDEEQPAPAAPKQKAKPRAAVAEEEDENRFDSKMNLDDGIEVGDVFSMKKEGTGKCRIKAPFVDLMVDCDRNKKEDRD